jgi:hypothetical protein
MRALWVLPFTGIVALCWAALAPIAPAIALAPAPRRTQPALVQPYPAESLAHLAANGDVFRLRRTPAGTSYDPMRGAVSETPAAPKPQLALSGIVWGAEPAAIIEGLPGIEGPRVMRRGETVAGLRVREITRERVTVVGLDTTWTLKVKTSWN